jgi:rubrerythrin
MEYDMLAKLRCLKCNYNWESQPGPTQCPDCDHLYVKWENYEEMVKSWNEDNGI